MPEHISRASFSGFRHLGEMYICDVTHTENDTIYWVDMGLSTISRAKRDQTWREDVVTNGIGRVEGITVDWIAGQDSSLKTTT